MINTIRLNHTVWYSYEKKIIRINISDMLPEPLMSYSYTVSGQIEHPGLVKVHSISKDIKVFGDFNPLLFLSYAPLSGSSEETKKDDWDSRVELKWNEQHKSFDIVLPPHKDFDVDGEMVVTIYYHVFDGIVDNFTEDISSFMNTQYKLDVVANLVFNSNLRFEKTNEGYEVKYTFNYQNGEINRYGDPYIKLLTIPFSSLRELPTVTAGEPVTLEKILELVSDESKSEVISQLKSKLASTPLTAEQILDQATEAAADREKAGKLFQKLLDAETLNVVEKTDGYELSYTGDVNKVLVKIPKQAVTVSQEVITAALTENVVTETIKPTLDKSYYSKEEVDNLIKKLKEELTAEAHDTHLAEEHPQQ